MNFRVPPPRFAPLPFNGSATCLLLIGGLIVFFFPARIEAQPVMNLMAPAAAPKPPAQARGFFHRLAEGFAGRERSLGRSQRVPHAEAVPNSQVAIVETPRVAPRATVPRKQLSAKPVTRSLHEIPKPAGPQPSAPIVPEAPQFLGEPSLSALVERSTLYESGRASLVPALPVPMPDANAEPETPTALPEAGPPPFAKPVPGKKHFVYSPGAEESRENTVDVRGMAPGQMTRDPRTGKFFRVP